MAITMSGSSRTDRVPNFGDLRDALEKHGLAKSLKQNRQNSGTGSSGVSSVKPACEIGDLKVGKIGGEDYAYILAGVDKERGEKHGETVYEHTIRASDVIWVETEGRSQWGFLPVEKLPRWRKIVMWGAGATAATSVLVVTLAGLMALIPVVGPIPAFILLGVACLTGVAGIRPARAAGCGVAKLLTLGRSVRFTAETADLHLTGTAPKRDYDIFARLVREAGGTQNFTDLKDALEKHRVFST